MKQNSPICETCGGEYDPEMREIRRLLRETFNDHVAVANAMHYAMNRVSVRKGRRKHAETMLHLFYMNLCDRANLRATDSAKDDTNPWVKVSPSEDM